MERDGKISRIVGSPAGLSSEQCALNAALIQRLYRELFWDWNWDAVDRYFDPTFRSSEIPEDFSPGPRGVREFYLGLRSAFSDLKYAVEDLIACDDKVVVRWRWLATHTGPFRGIPPTGRSISMTGIAIYKVAAQKAVERWVEGNVLNLIMNLGGRIVVP